MLELKNTVTEMENDSDVLISGLDTAEEKGYDNRNIQLKSKKKKDF